MLRAGVRWHVHLLHVGTWHPVPHGLLHGLLQAVHWSASESAFIHGRGLAAGLRCGSSWCAGGTRICSTWLRHALLAACAALDASASAALARAFATAAARVAAAGAGFDLAQ